MVRGNCSFKFESELCVFGWDNACKCDLISIFSLDGVGV